MNGYITFMLCILLAFLGFFKPIMNLGLDTINQTAYFKTTTEYSDVLKASGGVSPYAAEMKDWLQDKNYTITVKDVSGNNVTSTVSPGTPLFVTYEYKYLNASGEKTLKTSNQVIVLKRS